MEQLKNIPKGRPKSGRVWKAPKQRFSKMTMDKPLKTSWEKKMKIRAEKKSVKNYEKELKTERSRELEAKRLKTEAKRKRALENSKKAEIVQPIKNTAKIKRMKKKQLKFIEKR